MNWIIFFAGILAIIVGIVHSTLGEILIFKHLRHQSFIPTIATAPLKEKHIRILWATWHIASFFGWGVGVTLLLLSFYDQIATQTIIHIIASMMCASGLLVCLATKAKHPGWIGLTLVAILCWLSLTF